MEVVGIAASFAGIVAFAGQAIDGIVQLRAFFKDVSLAPRRTEELLKDMESLADTLADIQQLITTLDRWSTEKLVDEEACFNTSILKLHLKCCAEDIATWVKVTKHADPRSEKGLKAFFKKVKITVDKSGFEELGKKISSYRQRIGISLSVLGRSLDHTGIERLDELSAKFDGLTEAHLKLSDTINMQYTARAVGEIGTQPQNMEAFMENYLEKMNLNHSDNQQSIQSLTSSISSLASHVSKLLEKTATADTSNNQPTHPTGIIDIELLPPDEWCCDTLSGIDDAFHESDRGYNCVYCSSYFIALSPSQDLSFERGRHLTQVHSFGSCNLAVKYQSWKELEPHLRSFHNLGAEQGRVIDRFSRKRRQIHLFRGDTEYDGQPSSNFERSTEGLVMMARLKLALDQVHQIGEISNAMNYFGLPPHEATTFRVATPEEQLFSIRHEIACIVEELIVSGNDRSDDTIDFVKSHPKLFVGKTNRQAKEVLGIRDGYTERNMINDWFLCNLKKSRTLRFFLTSGIITPGLPPAISPDWILPILKLWDIDEAATGLKQKYDQVSDGAIDSRDDLRADIDPKEANNQKNISSAEKYLTNPGTLRSKELAKDQANLPRGVWGLHDATQNSNSPADRSRRRDSGNNYFSLVTCHKI